MITVSERFIPKAPIQTVEYVDRENCTGKLGGSDYGSSMRVLARSPDGYLFSGCGGIHYHRRQPRGVSSWHDEVKLASGRVSLRVLESINENLRAIFWGGGSDAVIAAWKRKQTVIFDGGGEKLPLPYHTQAEMTRAWYAEHGVDWKADLTGRVKTCVQCATSLKPHTQHHFLGYAELPNHPRSVEDCQKLSNMPVIAIHGYGTSHKDKIGMVQRFETWDESSYQDHLFCSTACAAAYGRRAAQSLPLMASGIEPTAPERNDYRSTNHYVEDEPQIAIHDGKEIRI